MRRVVDVLVSGVCLIVFAPALALIGVAIKLESKGPVIFRQSRVGREDEPFEILKFRTMKEESGGPLVTPGSDPRITQVGRFLRSTKLDELPQLLNVIRGEMALVGPRPEVREYVDLWPKDLKPLILSVRPGITDPAALVYRRESEMLAEADDPERYYREVLLPTKAIMYANYVRTRSIIGDLRILAMTARKVATG